eukprot:Skav207738  [mRNA]  locus=scaffold362:374752:379339:- [translate_table: standard]
MDGFLCKDATSLANASPAAAFTGGLWVEVQVLSHQDDVLVRAIHASIPCPEFRCAFPSWVSRCLKIGAKLSLCNFQIMDDGHGPVASALTGSLLPIIHPEVDCCNIAEAFAGLGGWTYGLGLCQASVVMMVEIDPLTARAAAESHKCLVMGIEQALGMLMHGELPTPFVLNADVKDHRTWIIAGMLQVGWWVASPPCPPWSSAANCLGLDTCDGEVMLHFFAALGVSRAFGTMVENVPGLAKHDHFAVVKSTIKESGLDMVIADIKPVMPMLPVTRKRWLAVCVRRDIILDDQKLSMAVHMGLPPSDACLQPQSMVGARCVQTELHDWEAAYCLPDPEAIRLMSLFDLLPTDLKEKCCNQDPNEVLKLRIRSVNQPLQPIMARQGMQHKLPYELLVEKGLFAYLLNVDGTERYTTPYEVATCMGFPSNLVLPANLQKAWQMVGNSLAVAQAAWHYMRGCILLEPRIKLPCTLRNNVELCRAIETARCQLQDFCVVKTDEWMELVPRTISFNATQLPCQIIPTEQDDSTDEEYPSPKRRCISPTWDFVPMEGVIEEEQPAKDLSFMSLVFQPTTFVRIVRASFLEHTMSLAVDVTWKLCDMVAFVATASKVLASQVNIHHLHVTLDLQSFVLAHDLLEFDCELMPQLSETLRVPPCRNQEVLKHPVVSPPAVAKPGGLRFTVVDPRWGTTKTVSVEKGTTANELLCLLLPAYCANNMPVLSCGEVTIYGECPVEVLPIRSLEVAFPGTEFPVGPVIHQDGNDPWTDQCETLILSIKGPFEHRPRITKIPTTWTLLNIASHCLKDVNCKMTLMCLQGGRGLDPKLSVRMVDPNQTIDFRACALPGGGKPVDQTANKLKKILASKGVQEESLPARIALITSKIPNPELVTILMQDEHMAWTALKKKANEIKLRMVTTQELHDHQRRQRDSKQAASSDQPKKPPKASSVRQPKPEKVQQQVTVDLAHFHCEDHALTKLDIAQWGPDKSGITIANKDDASKLLPVTSLSVQPLALVVLTSLPFAGVTPVAVPAVRADGQPTLASVVILNYGDIPIECKPNVPKIELTPTPTSILEIFIERALVTNWNDCQCPLTYLGLHLPEIRKQQVIASWAFAPYDAKRSKCKHEGAEYWHGFVKIPEEHLHSTLTRSGQAGVFILVRSPDKRLDANFGAIPMHGQTLEEVIKLARSINEVLGVVQMGRKGPYALRGRREALSKIRLQAIPQGITMQEGQMQSGAKLWTLKNVRTSTTCGSLTDALTKLGWRAQVIRPVGKDGWLASSLVDPPATHLCLGDDYVAVAPLHRPTQPLVTKVVAADQVSLAGGVAESEPETVSTRLSDIKCDLEEKLTMKLSSMMDAKIQACDEKIATLNGAVEDIRTEVASTAAATQKQLENQSATIQSQLNGNNDAIMKQMQHLFTKMQTELQASFQQEAKDEAGDNKRTKFA